MRTIVAPLRPDVQRDLEALPDEAQTVARRYLEWLRIDAHHGTPIERGRLAEHQARRVYFDEGDRPGLSAPPRRRPAGSALTDGPPWRIVYLIHEAPRTGVRIVEILAIGRGHVRPGTGQHDAYWLAGRRLPTAKTTPEKGA